MQVRAGGAAGRADVADDVAALHARAGTNGKARQMTVARRESVAVRDVDDVAVAVGPLGLDHDSVSGGANGLADRGGDVDRVVLARFTGEGIGASTEAVRENAAHRRDGRSRRKEQ